MEGYIKAGVDAGAQIAPGGGGPPFGGYEILPIGREVGPEGTANYYQLESVSLPPGINLIPS